MSANRYYSRQMTKSTKSPSSGPLMFIAILLLISSAACGETVTKPTATPLTTSTPIKPGYHRRYLMVGDLERNYLLYIPPGLDVLQPVPVVFVFHGSGMAPGDMWNWGFNGVADKDGFLVVYPNGQDLEWNLGVPGIETHVDDFGFVNQMLADVGMIFRIDPKHIYSTGFSAGANFSYRLACEMSDTFAAIASVEGWMFTYTCQPQHPISIMEIHGLEDAYEGQTVPETTNGITADVLFLPVEQTFATWVQLDGCSGAPQLEKQGRITRTTYISCRDGTIVELDALEGGGHWWPNPGEFPTLSPQGIWNFFKAHPKP
jgi:polyhydroxybutyrate depolymerase